MALTKQQEKSSNRFYVYQLIDQRDGSVFYVGKGTGNRVKQHVKNAKCGRCDNSAKHERIMEILDSGQQVIEHLFKEGLSEQEAYDIEREMIQEMRDTLTNMVHGVVTENRKSAVEARFLLDKLHPVEDIKKYAHPKQLQATIEVFGSIEAYDKFIRNALNEIINSFSGQERLNGVRA